MKIANRFAAWKIVFLWIPFACCMLVIEPVIGQKVETFTMDSGLQFEGIGYSTSKIEGHQTVYSTYGSEIIVRIDDGLRDIFVGRRRVKPGGEVDRREKTILISQKEYSGSEAAGEIKFVGPFNDKGHREFVVASPTGDRAFVQAITEVNPRYCELKMLTTSGVASQIQWTMRIGTSTVPTDVLRAILRREIDKPENASGYFEVADFLIQAGRNDAAREEIAFIQKKFPDLKERLTETLQAMRQAHARQFLSEIRLRYDAGQLRTAREMSQSFSKEDLADTILAEFAELEERFDEDEKLIQKSRERVNAVVSQVANLDAGQTEALKRFKSELETDLNTVNVLRLDGFMRLADDATVPLQQKLALIISGWLMGSNNATENLAIAQELYEVRDRIEEYLRSSQPGRRDQILEELKKFESGQPSSVAAIIQQMRPVDAPDLKDYNGSKPIEIQIEIPRPTIDKDPSPLIFNCLVHLPTGYDPYRRYPLLVSLPHVFQSLDQNLNMWCGEFGPSLNQRVGHAERNGFIVMSVDWRRVGQRQYNYSAMEHMIVMKALRQALRKFSVDSDRVYLAGHADGGEAATDIGISHPEHWAGIVAVSSSIGKYSTLYRNNEHWGLPIYCVCGEKDIATIKNNAETWSDWIAGSKPESKFPDATLVMYRGRGAELFEKEETPEIFKWMNAQRRRLPDRTGFQFNCRILRPWDNYFWFLEVDKKGLDKNLLVYPEDFRDKGFKSIINVEASLKEGNKFRINRASKPMTLWLSPDFVDFDQTVFVTGQGKDFKEKVSPSTRVLLEDVRRRGDREHPYWAKLNLSGYEWSSQ